MVCQALSQKYSTQKRAGVVTQMTLSSMREALSSNPSTVKKQNEIRITKK
jgi:hypothetical protein